MSSKVDNVDIAKVPLSEIFENDVKQAFVFLEKGNLEAVLDMAKYGRNTQGVLNFYKILGQQCAKRERSDLIELIVDKLDKKTREVFLQSATEDVRKGPIDDIKRFLQNNDYDAASQYAGTMPLSDEREAIYILLIRYKLQHDLPLDAAMMLDEVKNPKNRNNYIYDICRELINKGDLINAQQLCLQVDDPLLLNELTNWMNRSEKNVKTGIESDEDQVIQNLQILLMSGQDKEAQELLEIMKEGTEAWFNAVNVMTEFYVHQNDIDSAISLANACKEFRDRVLTTIVIHLATKQDFENVRRVVKEIKDPSQREIAEQVIPEPQTPLIPNPESSHGQKREREPDPKALEVLKLIYFGGLSREQAEKEVMGKNKLPTYSHKPEEATPKPKTEVDYEAEVQGLLNQTPKRYQEAYDSVKDMKESIIKQRLLKLICMVCIEYKNIDLALEIIGKKITNDTFRDALNDLIANAL